MKPTGLREQQQRKIKTQAGFLAALDRKEGNDRLRRNHGVVASFSRALVEGLSVQRSDSEFDATLDAAIQSIFEASRT